MPPYVHLFFTAHRQCSDESRARSIPVMPFSFCGNLITDFSHHFNSSAGTRHTRSTMASVLEASSHSYLGDQLRDTRARSSQIVEVDKIYRVLLVPLPDVVLFPGETIPLRIHNPDLVRNVQRIVEEVEVIQGSAAAADCDLIGVVNNPRLDRHRSVLCTFGTTIDVRSVSFPRIRGALQTYGDLVLTAKGKFRFQIISVQHQNLGIVFASAKLLPDSQMTPKLDKHALSSFPKWVYEVSAPATLAKRAYQMVEKSLFWKVIDSLVPDSSHLSL